MSLELYDLAGAEDDRCFSPNCWRVTMALADKGLACRTIPWRFTEKDAIAFSGQGAVPVLVDDGEVVVDSWRIALHLERKYASSLLMDGAHARGAIFALKNWLERQALDPVRPVLAEQRFLVAQATARPGGSAVRLARAHARPARRARARGARLPGPGLVSSRSRPTGRTAASSIPRSRSASY